MSKDSNKYRNQSKQVMFYLCCLTEPRKSEARRAPQKTILDATEAKGCQKKPKCDSKDAKMMQNELQAHANAQIFKKLIML